MNTAHVQGHRHICSHACVVLLSVSVSLNVSLHIDKQTRHSRPASLPQTVCALVCPQKLQVSIFTSCGPTLKQHPFSAISAQTCSPVLLPWHKTNKILIKNEYKQAPNTHETNPNTNQRQIQSNSTLNIDANRLDANKLDANKLDANTRSKQKRLDANKY